MEDPDRFWSIRLVLRWRTVLPWLAAAFVVLAGWLATWAGGDRGWLVAGLLMALPAGVATRIAVELVDLVSETLLPR